MLPRSRLSGVTPVWRKPAWSFFSVLSVRYRRYWDVTSRTDDIGPVVRPASSAQIIFQDVASHLLSLLTALFSIRTVPGCCTIWLQAGYSPTAGWFPYFLLLYVHIATWLLFWSSTMCLRVIVVYNLSSSRPSIISIYTGLFLICLMISIPFLAMHRIAEVAQV